MKILQRAALLASGGTLAIVAAAGPRPEGTPQVASTHVGLRALLEARLVPPPPPEPEPKPNQPVPELEDFLVGALDGTFVGAVVAPGAGDKRVLVPLAHLRYAPEQGRPSFRLALTREELEALPPFGGKGEGAQNGVRLELASAMARAALQGSDMEFGKVADAAVAVANLRLDYLLVAASAPEGERKTFVVPYLACQLVDRDGGFAFASSKTGEQLLGAPVYVKPNSGFFSLETMRLADEYFGVRREPPK
jgi:hypothetical protein